MAVRATAITNEWRLEPGVSTIRRGYANAITFTDGKVYLFGGGGVPGWKVGICGAVEIFDPEAGTVTRGADMLTPREAMTVAIGGDGLIYCMGGRRVKEGYYSVIDTNIIEAYDPITDIWITKNPFPYAPFFVFSAAATWIDGKIYCFGGFTGKPDNRVFVYDPWSDTWQKKPNLMATTRWGAVVGMTSDNKIWVIGGYTDNIGEYDPITDNWIPKTSGPFITCEEEGVIYDDVFYILGGNSGVGSQEVKIFDTKTEQWTIGPPMILARTGCAATVGLNGRIYAMGGNRGGGAIDSWSPHIEASFDFDPNTLNIKSKGKWVTVYIELPVGYDVTSIDLSTVYLMENILAESKPTSVGDYDNDGIPDLMLKFDRTRVQSSVTPGEVVEINILGQLIDGTVFKSISVIRVIDEGNEHTNEEDPSSVE